MEGLGLAATIAGPASSSGPHLSSPQSHRGGDRLAISGGVKTQERRWRDDHCSDPEVPEAIDELAVVQVVEPNEVAGRSRPLRVIALERRQRIEGVDHM